MHPYQRVREIDTGRIYSTRNPLIAGVTELVDRPAVDCYGAPLPPKHPAYDRVIRASIEADEATTAEATEEAANHDD